MEKSPTSSPPENVQTQEIVINFNHSIKLTLKEDSKLSDLKELINKSFLIREDEYEIYIKDMQLLIINQELKLCTLLQTYQTNEFTIKAYKSKK